MPPRERHTVAPQRKLCLTGSIVCRKIKRLLRGDGSEKIVEVLFRQFFHPFAPPSRRPQTAHSRPCGNPSAAALFPDPRPPDRRRKKLVCIADQLLVEKMQRNVLRTDPGAFTAIGAAGGHMERADDMEEVFFEVACRSLVVGPQVMIVKHAGFARTCRTDVPAGVAADAAGKLPRQKEKRSSGLNASSRSTSSNRPQSAQSSPCSPSSSSKITSFLLLQVAHFKSNASAFFVVSSP